MSKRLLCLVLMVLFGKTAFSQLPVADFSLDKDSTCTGYQISFADLSTNSPTSWAWSANPATGVSFNTAVSQNTAATFNVSGTYTVFLVATNSSGSDTDSVVVVILPPPVINATPSAVLCAGDSVQLLASGAVSYQWSPGTFLSDSLIANPLCFPASGSSYIVSGTDVYGCIGTATTNIVVNALPVVSGTAGTPGFGIPATVAFTSNYSSADSVVWDFGDGSPTDTSQNPNHVYTLGGTYTVSLTAYNAGTCTSVLFFEVTIVDASSIYMPNFFSPNYDDVNDVFGAVHKGIKEFNCVVYDRWGIKIYEWNKANGWWDGHTTSGIECSVGVYYYVMKSTGFDGKEYEDKGYIHLFR